MDRADLAGAGGGQDLGELAIPEQGPGQVEEESPVRPGGGRGSLPLPGPRLPQAGGQQGAPPGRAGGQGAQGHTPGRVGGGGKGEEGRKGQDRSRVKGTRDYKIQEWQEQV